MAVDQNKMLSMDSFISPLHTAPLRKNNINKDAKTVCICVGV